MTKELATKLLDKAITTNDADLFALGWYICWTPGNEKTRLDGWFTADELEAIAWWMRNNPKQP